MTDIRLLNFKQVQEKVNLTRGHIYRLINQDKFPPIKIGRASRWRSDEIDNWVLGDHPRAQITRIT